MQGEKYNILHTKNKNYYPSLKEQFKRILSVVNHQYSNKDLLIKSKGLIELEIFSLQIHGSYFVSEWSVDYRILKMVNISRKN